MRKPSTFEQGDQMSVHHQPVLRGVSSVARRLPVGAEPTADGVHFRIWAPDQPSLAIQINGVDWWLDRDDSGYFAGLIPHAASGTRYQIRLANGQCVPDPASRYQPDGPHGDSQVVDPAQFTWTDAAWKGRSLEESILYEMHIGTMTLPGTWQAAQRELPELARLGVTCIEVMPVAEFPGRWGWGYDGVLLFAPSHLYGTPDEFRAFVNEAHRHGIGVILDVVYNHLGPDGNHLHELSQHYFTHERSTDWGTAINFDGPDCIPVREFFTSNAAYWIQEFHLDGLRLDATQDIHDDSPPDRHILTEITRHARSAAPDRKILVIGENEPQHSSLCRPASEGGYGLDALWNDDFHHSAMVALTGRHEAYYTDYRGTPQEFISAAKYGYLYQGQWYSWQNARRGTPGFDLDPMRFVSFIQNHDQIANSGRGDRAHLLGSPGRYRAMSALMLLGPGTPMLFQGQEFAASTPFLYFADHQPELARHVEAGRREFLSQFDSLKDPAAQRLIADSSDPETFVRCKLNFIERQLHADAYQLTRDLITLRRNEPCFRSENRQWIDGAVLGAEAFVIRFFQRNGQDRLLLVNLGIELDLPIVPEPLLGLPPEYGWQAILSTESATYGGSGVRSVVTADNGWHLPGEAAIFLGVVPTDPDQERPA